MRDVLDSTYRLFLLALFVGIAAIGTLGYAAPDFIRQFPGYFLFGFLAYFVSIAVFIRVRVQRAGIRPDEFRTYLQTRPLMLFFQLCLFAFVLYRIFSATPTK